ncbi:Protein ELF4-LIKE 4 [Tetrabaena socialis]|uniref:Protein ELF4-LIKE 4 n=1 Tax=Tetrabaena socialis TaxID=47790 RepID=A0A2J8A3V1_9CHLO|nr:Protein ELF4-LIKE 4 [Tetrabaena socialis]|eukprot:PNH07194.1 Protein ELF4-LIKE 4 [Tetrabaena socialis]
MAQGSELWPGFRTLENVQEILERNKLLISEINLNHELRTPESLLRNVILIRELNGNMATVVEAYRHIAGQLDLPGAGGA